MSIDNCKDCGQFTDTDIDAEFYYLAEAKSPGYCANCRKARETKIEERGDSAVAINNAADKETWDRILPMMKNGARLRYNTKTQRFYTDFNGYYGQHGIGKGMVRKLEKTGQLINSGVDTYSLTERTTPNETV